MPSSVIYAYRLATTHEHTSTLLTCQVIGWDPQLLPLPQKPKASSMSLAQIR